MVISSLCLECRGPAPENKGEKKSKLWEELPNNINYQLEERHLSPQHNNDIQDELCFKHFSQQSKTSLISV